MLSPETVRLIFEHWGFSLVVFLVLVVALLTMVDARLRCVGIVARGYPPPIADDDDDEDRDDDEDETVQV